MCGLVVAGLGLDIAGFEYTSGVEGDDVVVAVGGTHVVYALCSDFHA